MSNLKKITPAWHAVVAAEINRDFVEVEALAHNARRRRAYLGLKFIYVKERGKADRSIPHGRFSPWLAKHCPIIPRRTIGEYMLEASSICERLGWLMGDIPEFKTPPHQLLIAADGKLAPTMEKQRRSLLELVDHKGRFQAVTQYKQLAADGEAGEEKSRRGRLKGCTGTTREQRLKASGRPEEHPGALALRADEQADWARRQTDRPGLGTLDSRRLAGLRDAWAAGVVYINGILKSRKAG